MLRSAQGVVVDGAMVSDPGRDPDKQTNEDAGAIAEMPFGVCAVVCDGMGGHDAGELASRAAIQRIVETLSHGGGQSLERLLATAIERAHAEVYALGGDAPIDVRPGSTAVVLALAGQEALVAHVGDSRAYRVRARHTERLTRDHSVVEALLAAGAIREDAARQHPDANRITRALGIAADVEPELRAPMRVELGDVFILCSDGLSDLVEDDEIARIVSEAPAPEAAAQSLVALANSRGGHDNITVAVLRVLSMSGERRENTQEMAAPEPPHTVVAGPAFTVAMPSETAPPTPDLANEPRRNTAPTLVDPLIAQGHHAAAQPSAASAAAPAHRTQPEIRVTVPSASAPPTKRGVPVLFWASLTISALILFAIAIWSALR